MSDPYWQHSTETAARWSVWAEEDWEGGVAHCQKMIALPELADGSVVIDVGCGMGRLMIPYAKAHPGVKFHGTDPSPTMLELVVREALPNVDVSPAVPVELFPWADFAYSVVVLQHLPPYTVQGIVWMVRRALKDGGVWRFQFVEAGEEAEHNHPLSWSLLDGWLHKAGFTSCEYSGDERFPTWTWVTAS